MIYVDSMNNKTVTVAMGAYTPPDGKIIKSVLCPEGATFKGETVHGPDYFSTTGASGGAGIPFVLGSHVVVSMKNITVTAGYVVVFFTDKNERM